MKKRPSKEHRDIADAISAAGIAGQYELANHLITEHQKPTLCLHCGVAVGFMRRMVDVVYLDGSRDRRFMHDGCTRKIPMAVRERSTTLGWVRDVVQLSLRCHRSLPRST